MRIFDEQISRKPNLYPWTDKFIKSMQHGLWTDAEFTFSSDVQDFNVNLSPQEKEMIVRTLSAVGQIEIQVKEFWGGLGKKFPHPSMSDLGYVMSYIEVVHNNAYERLLETLGIEDVFNENLKLDWIQGRVKYLKKHNHKYYKDANKQNLYAVILFTLFVENVSLFSQFYIIKSFGKKNLLKDTNQQVTYTAQEEQIHALVGIQIVNTIRQEYPELFDAELEEKILSEAKEAFIAESKIIDWMVDGIQDEPNLSAVILKEFVKDRINESLSQIGFSKVFEIDQEIIKKTTWFNEEVLGNGMTDFFFQRPVEYSKKSQSFSEGDLF